MRFNSGFLTSFMLASAVLADSVEHSPPLTRAGQVTYESFQAGVVLKNSIFRQVTVSFIAPWLTGDPGSGINIFAAIDGEHCNDISFRAGVKGEINVDGSQVYTPYYQWHPRPMQTFENVTVSSGDTVTVLVTAVTPGLGTVMIVNTNKNQSDSLDLVSFIPLCQTDVSWIVEPLSFNDAFHPLANFFSISLNGFAFDNTGRPLPPASDPEIHNIVENNQPMTSVSIEGTSVTVTHMYW